MKTVQVYIAMSVDGYIADVRGAVDWLAGDGSEPGHEGSYPAFFAGVDTVVMGYATYRQIVTELSPQAWPYAGRQTYVLTRQKPRPQAQVVFTDTDPVALVQRLRRQSGGALWVLGGASVIRPILAAGLADEITVSVIPVLLGQGLRLFQPDAQMQKLQLTATRTYNGIVDLVYRPLAR